MTGMPKRYLLVFLLWTGFMTSYHIRTILSATIEEIDREYQWGNEVKGLALSAFFMGYIIFQIPGGWLATAIGGKTVLGLGVLVPSISTLAIPYAANSFLLVVLLRVISGLFQGVVYPSAHALLGKWAHGNERSRFVGIVWSGSYLGTALTFPFATFIMDVTADGNTEIPSSMGWRAVFLCAGVIGIVWWAFWQCVAYSSPGSHPSISAEEEAFLRSGVKHGQTAGARVPWSSMLQNRSVWALIIGHTTHNWGFYLMLTWLPSFFRLQFANEGEQLVSNQSIAVFPYLACFLCSVVSGPIAERLLQQGKSLRWIRLCMQSVGELVPAAVFLLVPHVPSYTANVLLFTIAVGATGFSSSGFGSNHLDIAPEYAGVLMGLSNCAATLPGIIAPYVTGAMLGDQPCPPIERWNSVFILAALVSVLGVVVWFRWMKTSPAKLQSSTPYQPVPSGESSL